MAQKSPNLAAISKLAGQTFWYGLSNVGARMLNFLLTPLLTALLDDRQGMVDFGGMNLLYAWIAMMNIIFTYGLETAYFRFVNKGDHDRKLVFQTAFGSLIWSTLFLTSVLVIFRHPIQEFLQLNGHAEYVTWCGLIIALDTLAAIPFARLRQDNKPRRYAFIKLFGIIVNIFFVVLFVALLPKWIQQHPGNSFAQWYQSKSRLGFIVLANLLQNVFVFLALYPEWRSFRLRLDTVLWKKMVTYSAPMIVIGLAGMANEVIDRQLLDKLLPYDNETNKTMVGIYSANYKLAIFITLFIQAFKMAAEPFFFAQAREKGAPALYAKVMKWFVITLAIAFLFSALYLDVWKVLIIRGEGFRQGIGIVPILLFANICLGIYYNLSVWYKLTDRMYMGIYITVFGALITFVGNYLFIPRFDLYAAAWTTLVCYGAMVVVTWWLGRRYFPVPYPIRKIVAYLVIMLGCYFLKYGIDQLTGSLPVRIGTATILFIAYLLLVMRIERKEMQHMPLIGKYIR